MSDSKTEQIKHAFTYHAPKPEQIPKYNRLREEGKALALTINELSPDSREKSVALTKLEEAVMWANAAIARNS